MKKPDFSLINRKAILGKKEEEENKRSSSAKLWGVVKNV
jgi:16S rRNA C1402 N4-methylase RsmH